MFKYFCFAKAEIAVLHHLSRMYIVLFSSFFCLVFYQCTCFVSYHRLSLRCRYRQSLSLAPLSTGEVTCRLATYTQTYTDTVLFTTAVWDHWLGSNKCFLHLRGHTQEMYKLWAINLCVYSGFLLQAQRSCLICQREENLREHCYCKSCHFSSAQGCSAFFNPCNDCSDVVWWCMCEQRWR